MKKSITVLKGDGIGPEIVNQAIKVLDSICKKYSHEFIYTEVDIGGCSIDKHGVPITDEGMAICKSSDSVLLGAVGGPKWDNVEPSIRPEKALLAVRSELGLFANLRPTKLFSQLADSSPLKKEIVGNGIDLMIVLLFPKYIPPVSSRTIIRSIPLPTISFFNGEESAS